jgi:spermidine/putrescine transport system ATP-binding protein
MRDAMAAPLVAIDRLTVSYGPAVTVGPISLVVNDAEFISLLGPSGCGKTTTLRCIAGFEHPASGDIRIRGRSIVKDPPHRRNVGFVFQNYALFPHLKVADNIAFGLRRRGVPRQVIAQRVDEMIARLGLSGLAGRLPSELSGGQQQRVALGRALAFDPDVLLLDEPLSNLDRKLRIQLRAELRRIHREFHKTLIFVTHDQEEALSLSDRIAVMMGGHIVQVGTPTEIYENPQAAEIADFIGDCRLFGGHVVDVAPAAQAVTVETAGGIRWTVPLGDRSPAPGERMRIAVRADAVSLAEAAMAGQSNVFEVSVLDKLYTGGSFVFLCRLGQTGELPVPVPQGHPATAVKVGGTVLCAVDAARIACFAERGG